MQGLVRYGSRQFLYISGIIRTDSKKCCKKEIRKIDMMLGTTTREVELSTIQVAGLAGEFSMPVEVTKVNKSELLYLDNPKYEEIIKTNEHMQ